jgi:hypothetical protein
MQNPYDIVYLLRRGKFDDLVDEIFSAARDRIRVVARKRAKRLKAGDDVQFNDRSDPKAFAGVFATVISISGSTVTVEIHESCGEYAAWEHVEAPASCLKLV